MAKAEDVGAASRPCIVYGAEDYYLVYKDYQLTTTFFLPTMLNHQFSAQPRLGGARQLRPVLGGLFVVTACGG